MAIRPPGLRLIKSVPLPYVQRSVSAPRRPFEMKLSLTSMIDCLVVMVVFLLMAFTASSQCPPPADERVKAHNVEDMLDLPVVSVRGGEVLLDGAFAGTTHALEASNRVQRIDELFDGLRSKRALYRQLHPDRPYPGRVLLDIDAHAPAVVLKSVVSTAALAGIPNVAFVVDRL
jgi:biopolymer transport protein ExbD